MVQVAGSDLNIIDTESSLHQIVKASGGSHVIECERRIVVLHLAGEGLAQRLPKPGGAVNIPMTSAHEQGRKKWKSLDVIPVCMTDKNAAAQGRFGVCQQRLTQLVRT